MLNLMYVDISMNRIWCHIVAVTCKFKCVEVLQGKYTLICGLFYYINQQTIYSQNKDAFQGFCKENCKKNI